MALRKNSLSVAWLFLLLCFAPAVAMAQTAIPPTKEQTIRKLLIVTDSKGVFQRSIQDQMNSAKRNLPSVPPKFWDEVLKEIDADKFIEQLIPIYDKHFTEKELEGLIAFYETELGKRLLAEMPPIMTESSAVGERYGKEIAEKVIQRMQADGTLTPEPARTPPPVQNKAQPHDE